MAGVKISQLQDGGALQSTDAFAVARGSFTRKILGAQLLDPIQNLNTRINDLSANTIFVQSSPTIDLTYNNSTRTLSADSKNFLPFQFIYGLTYSRTSNTQILVEPGVCISSDLSTTIKLDSPKTLSVNTVGANGLQATLQADKFYNLFVISNSSGSQVDIFSSVNSTPTLPSGYSLYRQIGIFYVDDTSIVAPFTQLGKNNQRKLAFNFSNVIWRDMNYSQTTAYNYTYDSATNLITVTVTGVKATIGCDVWLMFNSSLSDARTTQYYVIDTPAANQFRVRGKTGQTYVTSGSTLRMWNSVFGGALPVSSIGTTAGGIPLYQYNGSSATSKFALGTPHAIQIDIQNKLPTISSEVFIQAFGTSQSNDLAGYHLALYFINNTQMLQSANNYRDEDGSWSVSGSLTIPTNNADRKLIVEYKNGTGGAFTTTGSGKIPKDSTCITLQSVVFEV